MMLISSVFFNSYNSLSYFSFIFSLQDEAAYDVLQGGPAKQSQVTAKEVGIDYGVPWDQLILGQ